MGVIFTDDVTDDAGRFLIGFVSVVAKPVHGVEHATMDRFQAIPDIWKGAAYDYAHGVFHVGLLHLLFDVCREDFAYAASALISNQSFSDLFVKYSLS